TATAFASTCRSAKQTPPVCWPRCWPESRGRSADSTRRQQAPQARTPVSSPPRPTAAARSFASPAVRRPLLLHEPQSLRVDLLRRRDQVAPPPCRRRKRRQRPAERLDRQPAVVARLA